MLEQEGKMNEHGYMIVLTPSEMLRAYEARLQIGRHRKEYEEFRQAFVAFCPTAYRGVSREPLNTNPWDADGTELRQDRSAKDLMRSLMEDTGEDDEDDDEDLVPTEEGALRVHQILDRPAKREIIGVRRRAFADGPSVLGFDVGYWGGDHFSLIADTVVIPTWHGPPEEDYQEVAEKLSALNQHLLFNTASDAETFQAYYKSKGWAETEAYDGEFCIMQIETIEIRAF